MRLLRLAEVPTSKRDRVFRYSPVRALFVTFAMLCAIGGLVLLGWRQRSSLAYYIAGVLLLGLVLMRRFILARFRSSDWLARMSDEGLFVQFRSYLNYHFPGDAFTVVFIPFPEIRSVRMLRQRRDIPDRDQMPAQVDRVSEQRRRLVEVELTGDSAPLAQALANESARRAPEQARWYGATATQHKHYPVRMTSPTCLQLEWSVVPNPTVLLDALRRYTNIAAPVEVSQDYVNLKGLSREEQEKRLLELAETGQTTVATYIARRLFSTI